MKYLFYIAAAVLIAGCGPSSKITSSWKSETVQARKYNKILVLGITREQDRSIQEAMENHLAGDLRMMGYTVVSALQQYGPKAFEKMEEGAVIDKLKNTGVDAILTIVLLDKQKEKRFVHGTVAYYYSSRYNRFWDYRGFLYQRIYEPGYYVTDTRYFWESNLYDMANQQLVYSVQTQSFDPSSTESMGHEYGQLIVKNMTKEKVLADTSSKGYKAF